MGRPRLLNLRDLIKAYVDHRHDVVIRRTRFDLKKAEDRAHILEGLIIASDNIDEVIAIIKASKNSQEAIANLIERFSLSDVQARAIVEMRLRQLTGLEQDKLRAEYEDIQKLIAYLKEILENEDLCMEVIKGEMQEIKNKYGDERKTDIIYTAEAMTQEDFYADDEMIITISHMGYMKRTPLSEFRAQNRGGVGSRGSDTRNEDFIEYMYPASMHNYMLLFTRKGRCYWLRVFDIPEGSKASKGRAIQNLLNIAPDDKVTAFIKIKKLTSDPDFVKSHYLLFCTKRGVIKKTILEAFSNPRQRGVGAITLLGDDEVIEVLLTNGDCEVVVANRKGLALRFHESRIRPSGRTSRGVIGMRLDGEDNEVVGLVAMDKEEQSTHTVMVVSELGFGKRTRLNDENGETIYRISNRGGKGVKTMNITERTGSLVSISSVTEENDLMIINKSGVVIRFNIAPVSITGRATQGVKLINLGKRSDQIASICKVLSEPDEELFDEDGNPILDSGIVNTENESTENIEIAENTENTEPTESTEITE